MSSQRRNPAAGGAARRASALDFPGGNVRTEVRIETTDFQSILIGQPQTNSREAARSTIKNDSGHNLVRAIAQSTSYNKLKRSGKRRTRKIAGRHGRARRAGDA
jgi:hypothetical protein